MIQELTNLEQITGGGQKEVYKADHPSHGKVVLKKIFTTGDSLERTKREIRAVKLLEDPNIPKIYWNNTEDANPNPVQLIEERIKGDNLREILITGKVFGLKEVLFFLETILTISVKLEINNLVHRDIKPENIMIDNTDKFWLIDFGISRHLDLESLTDTANRFGLHTMGYASAEQFRNNKKAIDIRSDLFSIGVVCHEMLQGQNFYLENVTDPFRLMHKLSSESIPLIQISGDPEFKLSAFIRMLGDHRRYRRPRNAKTALSILNSIKKNLTI